MNNVSKVKIAVGYTLLLAVLFFSLFFVHREMENLILTDDRDVQWTDSVLALIREKDTNTIKMLRTLSEANDSMVSTSDIEQIIAQQDSVVTQQRVHPAPRTGAGSPRTAAGTARRTGSRQCIPPGIYWG